MDDVEEERTEDDVGEDCRSVGIMVGEVRKVGGTSEVVEGSEITDPDIEDRGSTQGISEE